MNDFVKTALKELKEVQSKESLEFEEIKQLVQESKKKTRIFRFGSVDIEIYGGIPKAIPKMLAQMEAAVSDGKVTSEELISLEDYFSYKFMSMMCTSAPYNTMEFWYAFDEDSGIVNKISKDIIEQLSESKEKIIEFRKK